jgi:serine phosphatase RsbU (regulator of sigma subunit)
MSGGTPTVLENLGKPLQLAADSPESVAMLKKAIRLHSLTVIRIATPTSQRFGYAFAADVGRRTYVTYAEQVLPADRLVSLAHDSPLRDLQFAIYYGTPQTPNALVETNSAHLPLHGTLARAPIPFGDQVLSAVVTSRTPLLGWFAASISWLILGAGVVLTCLMAVLTERMIRRRAVAEQLAAVAGELYQIQRGVAETLQTSLLPQTLPAHPQLQVATRYIAGTEGINVGGDWYDLVDAGTDRVFFTIGDVSGRGLSAASMMSRLRHSITAYALEGHPPATVLAKVSDLVDFERDEHFATVLCGSLDLGSGIVTVANAGHPPLALVAPDRTTTISAPVGPPVGIGRHYESVQFALRPGAILLAYTDGLVERRGQAPDSGITELCRVARPMENLDDLLDLVLLTLTPGGAVDDTAIMGLRWNS